MFVPTISIDRAYVTGTKVASICMLLRLHSAPIVCLTDSLAITQQPITGTAAASALNMARRLLEPAKRSCCNLSRRWTR